MSEKIRQYLQQAEEAERMALGAADEEERAAFLRIAALWRDMAETRAHLKEQQE
ncbi:hypothetical protein [Phenylobacterium zucineum]|uniref:hypothetical protein n=1 Tax=Phenylobacterium zucineum TaxID=284016 RepID=UPI0002EB401F|nr:hypothetical protein [Phenylobacterium zucineum]